MSTQLAVSQRATYQDLFALPEHVTGQILNGELIVTPRPASPHSFAASVLGTLVGGPFMLGRGGGAGGWWILYEPELHLGEDILVPDLAGWRRERMPVVPSEPFHTLPPDWVCEILSPSGRRHDRVLKPPIYGREKVEWMWIIDPLEESLEVFHHNGENWVLFQAAGGSETVRVSPFESLELELGLLWISCQSPSK